MSDECPAIDPTDQWCCLERNGHIGPHDNHHGEVWLDGRVIYTGGTLIDTQPKLRYDLIPEPALAAMAHAFTVGTKHGDGIKVESFATEYAAIMRHLEACRRGETVDPDDGHLHLGAVMARCAKLIATGTTWEGE